MTTEDAHKVLNLKHAWKFILSQGVIQYPSNYAIVSQTNAIVQEGLSYDAGRIRSAPVAIGGSSYIPPLPFEDQVREDIRSIAKSDKEPLDKTIETLLYVKKKQMFLNGNKRRAVILANHILIKSAAGLIVIPAKEVGEYKRLLVDYYETDKNEEIIKFLKDECCGPLR